MNKKYILIILSLFALTSYASAQHQQTVYERRYCVRTQVNEYTANKEKIGWLIGCNSKLYHYASVYFNASGVKNYIYTNYNNSNNTSFRCDLTSAPSTFYIDGYIGETSSNGRSMSNFVNYSEGSGPLDLTISGYRDYDGNCRRSLTVKLKVIVDGPAVITNVSFDGLPSTDKTCGTPNIIVTTNKYYNNTYGRVADLQILDRNNTWQTLKTVPYTGGVSSFSYETIMNHVDLGRQIRFRTVKRLDDYELSSHTSTKYLYYLPKFKFPDGTDVIVDYPICKGESPTIKIPFSDNNNYNLAIRSTNTNTGGGVNTADLAKEGNYYILTESDLTKTKNDFDDENDFGDFDEEYKFYPGIYELAVEHASANYSETPCPFYHTFEIYDIPEFTITNSSYKDVMTDNRGKTYQIRETGKTGEVSFHVSNSKTRDVYVSAQRDGGTYYTSAKQSLTPSSTIGGTTYYSGIVSINLYSGEYDDISVYNDITPASSRCYAYYPQNINLSQPDPISFDDAVITSPSCNISNLIEGDTQNGKIKLIDIKGGIGSLHYSIGNKSGTISGSGFDLIEISSMATGTYRLEISDDYNNSIVQNITIGAPPAIQVEIKDIFSPTLSCSSDGGVKIEAAGGAGGYSYSRDNINFTDTTNVIKGYSAGNNNKFYVKDDCGCVVEKKFALIVPNALEVDSTAVVAPTCYDGDDGFCTIIMNNVNGTLSVSDTPTDSIIISGDTIRLFNLSSGNKNINILDTYSIYECSFSMAVYIPVTPMIIIDTEIIEVSNKGSETGKISLHISGGNPSGYNVSLYKDALLQQQVGSTQFTVDSCAFVGIAGEATGKTYTIHVSDLDGCSETMDITVFEPGDTLRLSANIIKPVSCFGDTDAEIELTAEDGWGEYLYSNDNVNWNTNNVFQGYGIGTYQFYVKDKWNGTDMVSIMVAQPPPLTIEKDNIAHVLCNSNSEGVLRYRISGGTYPYTLTPRIGSITDTIINGDTLFTITGLKAGIYEFTVTDAMECSATALPDTITEPEKLQVSILNVTQPTCELDNGILTTKAAGGSEPYKYVLKNFDPEFPYQQIQENVVAGDIVAFYDIPNRYDQFIVTVVDNNGCSAQSSIADVNQYKNPSVASVTVNDLVCYGEKNGIIKVTPTSGTLSVDTYTIYNADSTYMENNTTGIFEELYAGDYWIDVFDANGCKSVIPFKATVREPDMFTIAIDTIMPVITKGEKDGKIYLRVQGGAEGSKTVRLKTISDVCVDSISVVNNLQFTMLVYAGTYYMEISDNQGCEVKTELFEVKEPAEPLRFIVTEKEDALCKAQTGRIVVEGVGGWGDYRYKRVSEGQHSTLNRFENLYPGSYLIEVTDKLGAIYRESIVIYEPQDSLQAQVVSLQPPTCGGNGSISIKLLGGTPPYVLYNEKDTITYTLPGIVQWQGYESGAQSFYLTDNNGCYFELEILIPETTLLKIERFELKHSRTVDSYDGKIEAFVTGGIAPYTYQWESNFLEMSDDSTHVLENIGFGFYSLTVTDAGGCRVEETVYLAEVDDRPLEILEIGHETSFEAKNGYAVLYADAALTDFALVSPQKIVYELTNTDITSNFRIVNDTIYLSNLEAGKWFILGTDDNAQYVAEFTINPYLEFIFDRTAVVPVISKGDSTGSIKVEIKGGGGCNQFSWTNSQSESITSIDDEYISRIDNLTAGFYTILVEDCYGNQISKIIEVREPAGKLTINLVDKKDQDCKDYEDAYVAVSANGGWGDYQFRHDSEIYFNNGSLFTALSTRDNYFYVIDKMGALDSIKVQITEPEYLRAAVARVDSVKCKDNSDGSILFEITGGTAPYRFKELGDAYWTDGNQAVNRSVGWYTYIFTDSLNCIGQDTLTVYVSEPDSLLFKNIQVTHTTCELDNGKISVSLQGGTRPYRYSWLDYSNVEIGTDSIATGLKQNGVYTLNVVDANGCTQQFRQLINPSTLPRVLQVTTTEVLCYGDTTGTARVTSFTAATPYAPYTFTWSNGDTGDYSARFEKGTHYVTIADGNGCSTTYYFAITQPEPLLLNFVDVAEPQCYGYGNGYIDTETFGGKAPYNYLWSTGATTSYIDNLFKGDYWVEVTDNNGCTFRKTITLGEPEYKTMDLGEDIWMCPGNTVVIDGQDFVSFRWFTSQGDISTQRYLSITEQGHYFLEATDWNGCSVWGDIQVWVGNQALKADLLLASQSYVGDTLVVFELSNMELDRIEWMYDPAVFERVYVDNEYNLPYIAHFKCLQTGIYNIGLYAYAGGCFSPVYKQVEIIDANEKPQDEWGYQEPLITSLIQYPNPTNGEFTVELKLREEAQVSLTLFEVASGICVNQRVINGQKENRIEYNFSGQVNTGAYVLIVTAGNERRQVKIIIK